MIYRVNWLWHRTGGVAGVCTQHVGDSLAWDAPGGNVAQVATDCNAKLTAPFRQLLANTYTLDSIVVTTVADPNIPAEVPVASEVSLSLAGQRVPSNNDLPPRIGGLLAWKTGYTPRYARGRMYCPPLESSTDIVGDLIATGSDYTAGMTSLANLVLDGNRLGPGADWGGVWDAEELQFVVYSPTRHTLTQTPFAFGINSWSNSRRLAYLSSRDS